MEKKRKGNLSGRYYLQKDMQEARCWGEKKLCRVFGITEYDEKEMLAAQQAYADRMAEKYGADGEDAVIASRACMLQGIGARVLDKKDRFLAGDIILTHPLKALTERQNRILAASLVWLETKDQTMVCDYLEKLHGKTGEIATVKAVGESILYAKTHQEKEQEEPSCRLDGKENFESCLEKHFRLLLKNIIKLTAGDADYGRPEVIHDLRVNLRTMSALSSIFSDYLGQTWNKECVQGINRSLKVLGSLRDADVMREKVEYFFANVEKEETQPASMDAWLNKNRTQQTDEIRAYCGSEEFAGLLNQLKAELDNGICKSALKNGRRAEPYRSRAVMKITIGRCMERTRIQSEWMGGSWVPEPVLHMLRLEMKKLRYVLEFFKEQLGSREKKLLKSVKYFQTVLGNLHDEAVLCRELQKADYPAEELQQWDALYTFCEKQMKQDFHLFMKQWKKSGATWCS